MSRILGFEIKISKFQTLVPKNAISYHMSQPYIREFVLHRFVCKNNDLTDSDLELLIYLDCIDLFTIKDFKAGTYTYSWNNRRWNKLIQNDWIVIWRNRNRTTQKYNIYKVSFKGKQLIKRIYRIMLGQEDINVASRNKIITGTSYSDKVMTKAIYNLNKDKTR